MVITVAVECHPHGLAYSSMAPGIKKETLKLKKATVGQFYDHFMSNSIVLCNGLMTKFSVEVKAEMRCWKRGR